MNTKSQEIIEMEKQISDAQPSIDKKLALERLSKNKDFKLVISEGYLQAEAVRLVHLKANPEMSSKENQEKISAEIDSIGHLFAHLRGIDQMGSIALRGKESAEAALVEIMDEQGEQ